MAKLTGMRTTFLEIGKISLNPDNPRLIKDGRYKKLVKSIQEFPEMLEIRPIVVNKDNMVLGGNMRLKACQEAGLSKVPVLSADKLTSEQQSEFIIKDNIGFGEWDFEILSNDWDKEKLSDWGFDARQLKFLDYLDDDDYEIPEEIKTDIKVGDLFQIGDHRLICGDSTDPRIAEKLLQGKEPYLMITDPPYGVKYDSSWRKGLFEKGGGAYKKVENDHQVDWSMAWAFSPAKVAYVYHAAWLTSLVQESLESQDFIVRSQIIWVKSNFAPSRGHYHWKHEPLWYAVKKGSKGNWAGDRKQNTVWEIAKNQANETGHSTQKPLECMARPMRNHDGDVYDPFLGSGTTMVACHELARKCYGIELSPEFCQIVIDRMKTFDPGIDVQKVE